MDFALLSLAFTSGVLIFFTPCGVALLPAYVTYIIGGEDAIEMSMIQKAWAGFKVGVIVSAGILAVFVVAAGVVGTFGNILAPFAKSIAIAVGALLIILGILMLAGRSISINIPHSLKADKKTTARFFLFGVGYALGGIGCTLPAFLFIVFAGLSSGSWQAALFIFLAFSSGTVLLMLAVTTISAVSSKMVSGLVAKYMKFINRVAGVVVVIAGLYLVLFQFGITVHSFGQQLSEMVEEKAGFSVYAGTDHTVTLARGGTVTLLPQSITRDVGVNLVRFVWGVAEAPEAGQFDLGEVLFDGESAEPKVIKFSTDDVGVWRFALRVEDEQGNAVEDEFRVLVQEHMQSLDSVKVVSAREQVDLHDDDEVIGIIADGQAMAYPRATMNYYGIANDVVGGVPVVVVFCDSCATGIAYNRTLSDGSTVLFKGMGGTLSEDRYKAVDQQKREWSIIDGRAIENEQFQLEFVDFEQTSWGVWQQKHPETQVMSADQKTG